MRIRLFAVVLFLVVGVVAGTANASGFFTDDDNSIHLRAIEAIADEGITKGCNPPVNDLYCPKATVTREQMATFLVRALDIPPGVANFTDIADSVHVNNIAALAGAGITKGCNPGEGNTLFCPKATVTREQMATFLVRALGLPPGDADFIDIDGSVHAANIKALASAGITKGCNPGQGNTQFCPASPVTREQMATFLARALDLDTSPRLVVTSVAYVVDVPLGASETDTVDQLTALLGTPTSDITLGCPYIVAPNTRYVRWGSLIVAIKVVDSGDGVLGLVGWRYKLDGSGQAEAGGPKPEHVEIPFGLDFGDQIGDATSVGGGPVMVPAHGLWMVSEFADFAVEATGATADPAALIDGVQQGFGFDCE
ncbi:MAG: S-layer homology domain-containing protein [bacterium]|nr:S-layer homology domain-containing protein [bacterium]